MKSMNNEFSCGRVRPRLLSISWPRRRSSTLQLVQSTVGTPQFRASTPFRLAIPQHLTIKYSNPTVYTLSAAAYVSYAVRRPPRCSIPLPLVQSSVHSAHFRPCVPLPRIMFPLYILLQLVWHEMSPKLHGATLLRLYRGD
jgi:hypothetical protein